MDIIHIIRGSLYAATKQELLLYTIYLEAFFTFPFIICSFVVAGTANAGFNCVLTGLLNVALVGGSYYVIKNSKAPIAVRFYCVLYTFSFSLGNNVTFRLDFSWEVAL